MFNSRNITGAERIALMLVGMAVFTTMWGCGLFDSDAEQTCDAFTLDQCFVGAAFADCPGEDFPKLYCATNYGCLWVSNGCPPIDPHFPLTSDCKCIGPNCYVEAEAGMAQFLSSRGGEPWTRTREMNLSVIIDSTIEPSTPFLNCIGCVNKCYLPANPCSGEEIATKKERPGTFVVKFYPTLVDLVGWDVELEVDLDATPPVARACVFHWTDAPLCKGGPPPVCAESGTVVLGDNGAAGDIYGTITAKLSDGMEISGAF